MVLIKDLSKPNKEIEKLGLKDIAGARVYLAFHFPPFIDLNEFKSECSKLNLPIRIEAEDENLKGLVLIECNSVDLATNLKDVQNALGSPIKKAIQKTNFENEIKEVLIKTDYFKSVLKFIQIKHKELKENKISKEKIIDEFYIKYGHIFGKEGIIKVAELFHDDESKIIDNYLKLQDYMLKHFSIEFFIQQQVEQGYYLLINIQDKGVNKKTMLIKDFDDTKFEQKALTIPAIGKVDNVLYSEKLKNVFITINPTLKNRNFNYAMLRLGKLNMLILFINFLFKKQSEGIRLDLENFEIEVERIKSLILDYDVHGISDTIIKLENLENVVYSYLNEFLMPIKRYIDELAPRSQRIEQQTLDEIFNVDVKIGGIVAKDKFIPPSWFSVYLFTGELVKSRELVYSSIEDIKSMLKILRELKEHLIKYQHELKLRKKEQFEATRKMIFETIKDLIDIIKKLLIGFPPKI